MFETGKTTFQNLRSGGDRNDSEGSGLPNILIVNFRYSHVKAVSQSPDQTSQYLTLVL